jgi:5-methylcytosine-specific restriction endonuclease McrA
MDKIDYSTFAFPKGKNLVKKKRKEDISNKSRETIKSLFKGKCGLCGKQGVHIHHIEYRNEDRSKIDDVENLILLCVECHNKVHENKKYWQPRLKKIREKLNSK